MSNHSCREQRWPAAPAMVGAATDRSIRRYRPWFQTSIGRHHTIAHELVLRNVHLIDGTGAPPRGPVDLTVRDGRIAQITDVQRPTRRTRVQPEAPPSGARVLDLDGAYVAPGLMDTHVHLTSTGLVSLMDDLRESTPVMLALRAVGEARKTLLGGFTTVRDAMADFGVAIDLGKAVERGMVPGPDIFAAGHGLSITGGHGDPQNGFPEEAVEVHAPGVVDSPDAARKATRLEIRRGARSIKLFATGGVLSFGDDPASRGLTEEEMRAAVEEAHNVGIPVLAHAQGTQGIKNAIRAGVDSIDHGIYLDDEAADMMAERGVAFVPTLAAVSQIVQHPGHPAIPPWALEKARAAYDRHLEAVQIALRAGVTFVLGTDAGTPLNFHGENGQELALMVENGLAPMEAIQAATSNAAHLLRSEAGILAEGRPADLVVTRDNPLLDIGALADGKRIDLVIRRGRIVREGRRARI